MLTFFLYGLFILSCLILILAVLLQPGKADAGALFTSSVSSTAFGPRGTQTLLAKITIVSAVAFFLIALTLSLPALTGSRSVLQSVPGTDEPAPAASPAPEASPQAESAPATAPEANANNAPDGNANATSSPAESPASSPAAERQGSPETKR